jgi:hypothetical protein
VVILTEQSANKHVSVGDQCHPSDAVYHDECFNDHHIHGRDSSPAETIHQFELEIRKMKEQLDKKDYELIILRSEVERLKGCTQYEYSSTDAAVQCVDIGTQSEYHTPDDNDCLALANKRRVLADFEIQSNSRVTSESVSSRLGVDRPGSNIREAQSASSFASEQYSSMQTSGRQQTDIMELTRDERQPHSAGMPSVCCSLC